MEDQTFYNVVTIAAAAIVIASFGVAYLGTAFGSTGPASPAAAPPSGPTYLYLTIQINPTTGMPQYSPANFTVTQGEVVVTIADFDAPIAWPGCVCNVTGTVGGTELVNGTSTSDLSAANIAHTFTVPALGLNVLSPGNSTVVFTADFSETGVFTWFCEDPCGADGMSGAPMATLGYMEGSVTVAP